MIWLTIAWASRLAHYDCWASRLADTIAGPYAWPTRTITIAGPYALHNYEVKALRGEKGTLRVKVGTTLF